LAQGGVTAAMPAGSWLGALISGFISDRLGRKYAIMVGCIIWYVENMKHRYKASPQILNICPRLGSSVPRLSALRKTWAC
jgi:MFS family permease